jgi:hypothetical protein
MWTTNSSKRLDGDRIRRVPSQLCSTEPLQKKEYSSKRVRPLHTSSSTVHVVARSGRRSAGASYWYGSYGRRCTTGHSHPLSWNPAPMDLPRGTGCCPLVQQQQNKHPPAVSRALSAPSKVSASRAYHAPATGAVNAIITKGSEGPFKA